MTEAGSWADTIRGEVKDVWNYTYYCSTHLHGMALNEQSASIILRSFFLKNKYNNFSNAENYETFDYLRLKEN